MKQYKLMSELFLFSALLLFYESIHNPYLMNLSINIGKGLLSQVFLVMQDLFRLEVFYKQMPELFQRIHLRQFLTNNELEYVDRL